MHRMTRDARGRRGARALRRARVALQGRRGRPRAARRRPLRADRAGVGSGPATLPGHPRHRRAHARGLRRRRGRRPTAKRSCCPSRSSSRAGALRYKGYSVMVHERATLRAGPVWSRTCIFCHNTVPEMDRLLGALAGPRRPRTRASRSTAGSRRRAARRVSVTDDGALRARRGRRDRAARRRALRRRRRRAERRPARHRRRPRRLRRRRARRGRHRLRGLPWRRARARPRSRACAPRSCRRRRGSTSRPASRRAAPQAHQPRLRAVPPGPLLALPVHLGGRAARRDRGRQPHQLGRGARLPARRMRERDGVHHLPRSPRRRRRRAAEATSRARHPRGQRDLHRRATSQLADASACARHAHHDPDGAGGSCVACHMPRKNMGLDGTLTRYHRIGSPTDAARVLGDRPLECALCHADRSVARSRRRDGAVVAGSLSRASGSRSSTARSTPTSIRATLERGKPHEQAVAMATLGEARARDAAPLIAKQLVNDVPARPRVGEARARKILGRCDVDLAADDESIARAAAACGAPILPFQRRRAGSCATRSTRGRPGGLT